MSETHPALIRANGSKVIQLSHSQTTTTPMKKRIGLLGGISHESTITYYRALMEKYFQKNGDYYYPEVVIFSLDFQKCTDYENTKNTPVYIDYILTGITALKAAGADVVAMCANSPHAMYSEVSERAGVPMISIVETCAAQAKRQQIKSALLLGIKFTMQSSFYLDVFTKESITIVTPSEAEQNEINSIIFKELVIGTINPESKRRFLEIIESYPCDAVILGCTEIPQLIGQQDTKKIVLNPLDLHVDALLAYSLGEEGNTPLLMVRAKV